MSVELDRVKENWCNSDVSLRTKLRESQLAQQDVALGAYLTNNYPTAAGDSVSARAIDAMETMDVQLGMKSAQQDGVVPFNEHDAGIIKDIEAMANGVEGFWPRALAIAALRLIRRPSSQPTPEAIVKAALEAAGLFIDDCDEAGENVSFSTMSASIRALDQATIIQAAKEGKA